MTFQAEQDRKTLHDQRFYSDGKPEVPPLMLDIFTGYSKIAKEEIVDHVSALRDRAWSIFHYPCIGWYRFLSSNIVDHPLYPTYVLPTLLAGGKPPAPTAIISSASLATAPSELLSAVSRDSKSFASYLPSQNTTSGSAEPILLDIGTCFGQDLRVLLHAGVPASRIFATDIEPDFISLGYDLFRDKDSFPASHQIAPVDLFDASNFGSQGRLSRFLYGVDILHMAAVFHLFGYNDQVTIGKRVLQLMRRQRQRDPSQGKGGNSVIFGSQTAHVKPTEYDQQPGGRGDKLLRHNIESWEKMWKEDITRNGDLDDEDGTKSRLRLVTSLTGINQRAHIKVQQGDVKDKGGPHADPGFRWMRFEVWVEAAD